METSQGYQALWDNWNGIGDRFVAAWKKIATRFQHRPEVVGFNLINEPFAGDFYHHPLLMVPYPSPTNADQVNLQPTYDRINAAVREVDNDVLLFIAGITWGDLGSGFTAPPGGPAFGNRTVVTYHFYEPPQFTAAEQVFSHVKEAMRLGTGAMLTETEAIWAPGKYDKKGNITDACDTYLQGWADWEWKSFVRMGKAAETVSQYGEWGAPKTGHGVDWNVDGTPPAYYTAELARTYAPRVAGVIGSMSFNSTTSKFHLEYTTAAATTAGVTDIYLLPERYTAGAAVNATASDGGAVSINYDGTSQWVHVQPAPGTPAGVRITVDISKK